MSEPQVQNDLPARVEQGDRVLTGGSSVEALEAVMERHAPDTETPEPAPAPPAPGEPPPQVPEPEQPKSRGARRFEALTAEREAAKRETVAEREKREALEKEVADLKARWERERPQPAARATEPVAPSAPQPTRPKPTEDEVGTKYQTYADFVEDLSDWKTEQRMAGIDLQSLVRSSLNAEREHMAFQQTIGGAYLRGREKFTDFDQMMDQGPGANILLAPTPQKGDERIAEILRHPQAEYILYALAKDATVAKGIAALSDIQFGYALSRLVPTDPAVAQPASTGIPSPVIAPAPYQPVGSGSKTTVLPSAELAKKGGFDYDKSGYREKRAAERGVRRR